MQEASEDQCTVTMDTPTCIVPFHVEATTSRVKVISQDLTLCSVVGHLEVTDEVEVPGAVSLPGQKQLAAGVVKEALGLPRPHLTSSARDHGGLDGIAGTLRDDDGAWVVPRIRTGVKVHCAAEGVASVEEADW